MMAARLVERDVQDVDGSWFEDVALYLWGGDVVYLTDESFDRLGGEGDNGTFYVLDDVEVERDSVDFGGELRYCWRVLGRLTTK